MVSITAASMRSSVRTRDMCCHHALGNMFFWISSFQEGEAREGFVSVLTSEHNCTEKYIENL